MMMMSRKMNESVTIGSLETTGYEITVKLVDVQGGIKHRRALLGINYKGKRVEIVRKELLEKSNET